MSTKTANIYIENFVNNILSIRNLYHPSVKMCIPVKAQAYGHGAVRMAVEALAAGVEYLAVATAEEGAELRANNIRCPILLLSIAGKEEIDAVVDNELTSFVHSKEYAVLLAQSAKKQNTRAHVHIKIDTGMGRIGCPPDQTSSLAAFIDSCKELCLDGVCTHLSVSDTLDDSDKHFTQNQIKLFTNAVNSIVSLGIVPGIIHCSNSGAVFLHPDSCFNMIRPGIAAYGYYPNPIIAQYMQSKYPDFTGLKPVMELCSKISQIKTIEKGQPVSYGRTWVSESNTTIATIPMGYADGLHRSFSPGICVSINGKKYPIIGRICMDQCMADLGNDDSINEGDTVIFFGPNSNCLTADDFAAVAKTISYEVLTSIGQRVKRIYV